MSAASSAFLLRERAGDRSEGIMAERDVLDGLPCPQSNLGGRQGSESLGGSVDGHSWGSGAGERVGGGSGRLEPRTRTAAAEYSEGDARCSAADAGVPEVSLPGRPPALRYASHVSQRHQRLLGGARRAEAVS